MKKILSVFIVLSVCTMGLFAHGAADPEQTWNRVQEQRQEASRAQEAQEIKIALRNVRAKRIQEALQLAASETGEPASAFTYKCVVPPGGRPLCDFANAVPFDFYRLIILQSRHKVCKYDSFGTYTNHAPAILGFFGHHDVEVTGSIECLDR